MRGSAERVAGYGDESSPAPATWHVTFVSGPWDGKHGRYYGLDGFPDMLVVDGRYVFSDVDDDGSVIYYFYDDDLGG